MSSCKVPARSIRPGNRTGMPASGIYTEFKPEPPIHLQGEEARKFEEIYQPPKRRTKEQEKNIYVPGRYQY